MAREVRVGDTVGWRDARGTFHDAIVTAVATQDSITISVPHIAAAFTTKAANVRRTNLSGTDVWHKEA